MPDNPSLKKREKDWALLSLRLAFGGLMALNHGLPKMQMLFSGKEVEFMNFLGLGPRVSLSLTVFAEFVCALGILIGFLTRLACMPLIITMLVAIFVVHFGDPIKDFEMAVLYLAGYMALFLLGSGRFSVDHYISKA